MAKILPITPSLLNVFLTCPRQYEAKYVTKEVVFQQSEAAAKGERIHLAAEEALKNGTPLTEEAAFMQPFIDWCKKKAAEPGMAMYVEESLAMDRDFNATDWWGKRGKTPWLRGKADVFFRDDVNRVNIVVDWKTGKPKNDKTQQHILALCARALTGYTKVVTMWAHVCHDVCLTEQLDVIDLAPVQEVLLDVARYEHACKNDQFPALRNGLCGAWCDVLSCEHNGKNK